MSLDKKKLSQLTHDLQAHVEALKLASDASSEQGEHQADVHAIAAQIAVLTKPDGEPPDPGADWPTWD